MEVFAAAGRGGVQLRFEGAVAGVVPAIRVMAETLAAAHIERVHGIVNGTTNYILTQMAATGAYAYAMANNYNAVPRPPVIFCRDGDARVVVRRESYDDLTRRDA